jgi:hypothetical protein
MTAKRAAKLASDPKTAELLADIVEAQIRVWNKMRDFEMHCGEDFDGFRDCIEPYAVTLDTRAEVLCKLPAGSKELEEFLLSLQ